MVEKTKRPNRRGRSARREARAKAQPQSVAAFIKRKIPLTEFLTEEGLSIIESNADTLLEEIGIEFRDDSEVVGLWKEAGANIIGERVRFPKGMLRDLIKTIRNRSIRFSGRIRYSRITT